MVEPPPIVAPAPIAIGATSTTVAADVGVGADRRAVLVRAVVVGGDAAGAVVDALADVGIADVGEVVRLRARRQRRCLDLDEVADVDVGAEHRAAAQAAERADDRAGADARAEAPRRRCACTGGSSRRRRRSRSSACSRRRRERRRRARPCPRRCSRRRSRRRGRSELAALVEARRIGEANPRRHQPLGRGALDSAARARRAASGC